ncbi:MAG: bifunctional UDP-N-acetylglucosamine diphosphorylase/glucosamine-1-phosphate N-acetyltransferase GlmU [Candidatus Aminicenantes bacterium]|nr:bifunctional UDP-N-acetylglucosamine diphosphorylase/glucosamine-1-phosphate N-acetyltransferase GlmU [Candidatus Aminicenantes bacterium]
MNNRLVAVILAAGQGTRFKSSRAKVLHPLLGRTMIGLTLDTVRALKPERIVVVVGHQKDEVERAASGPGVVFAHQAKRLGTAHALLTARPALRGRPAADVLVINADLPLLRPATLRPLIARHRRRKNALTFMTAELADPTGFGRVLRGTEGLRIVEEREASASERALREVNAGVYVFRASDLLRFLPRVSNANRKGEYYLTDLIAILEERGGKVGLYRTQHPDEVVGINTRWELARAAAVLRDRKLRALAEAGVGLADPATTWIDLEAAVGPDTTIGPGVVIEGRTRIGAGCRIDPGVHLKDSVLADGVEVRAACVIEGCRIETGAGVGPFARLRPGTVIGAGAHVGNFVEMKKADFGRGAKAGHLSYLGDAEVGADVNIGAGTITCNYDGVNKNRTVIGEGVFIGSGTELVAPVRIGRGAYVAAGSTITKDVPPDALAVARARQVEKPGWAARRRAKRRPTT